MDHFNDAVKKQVVTNTIDDLPKVYNSIVDAITEEHNAAMARTYLQSLGMLTEKHEVESKDSGPKDMESVRQMIAQHKSNTDSAE
ncbi:hypothetical protein JCM19037_1575 [Geomicrobium sp. JCM 19037]|uniref:hypothetical protein n=1 Tax=Geomicrobium sp. JCM 19037 TaxID=1460634 RepID=UPI00045F1C04|nr:hypothetical protein [Geomicrobium sp. JCM 19037]GAK03268.1 hypothetical protein JCM19037_1575 [Geomicrobium sp. JCM 19037]